MREERREGMMEGEKERGRVEEKRQKERERRKEKRRGEERKGGERRGGEMKRVALESDSELTSPYHVLQLLFPCLL